MGSPEFGGGPGPGVSRGFPFYFRGPGRGIFQPPMLGPLLGPFQKPNAPGLGFSWVPGNTIGVPFWSPVVSIKGRNSFWGPPGWAGFIGGDQGPQGKRTRGPKGGRPNPRVLGGNSPLGPGGGKPQGTQRSGPRGPKGRGLRFRFPLGPRFHFLCSPQESFPGVHAAYLAPLWGCKNFALQRAQSQNKGAPVFLGPGALKNFCAGPG